MRACIKKAAGGFKTTTATASHNAADFIAVFARPAMTKSSFALKPHAGTNDTEAKRFATLQAQFALEGHTLHQSGPNDGTVIYWAERWGLVRYLPTIDMARQCLDQIEGRL